MKMNKVWLSVYEKIVNSEDARACKAIDESACKVVPGNFIKIIIAQFFTSLGDAMINAEVTLPWVMQSVGAPLYLVAWLVPIRESGSLLPQLAIASFVRRMPIRKWVWVAGSALQAVSVTLIGLVALFMQGSIAGWMIILCLAVFSVARGLSSVASKDVLGKTIPKTQRGQVTGWSGSMAGLVTVGVAAILFFVALTPLEGSAYVYGLAVIGAASVWVAGALVYSTVKEFPGEVEGGKNGLKEALGQLALLKTDTVFRRFVITRSLLLCTALSAPFYIVLAQQTLGSSMWVLAMFIAASGFASLISAPFWGRFSDRSSRFVMIISSFVSVLVGGGLFLLSWLIPDALSNWVILPSLYFLLTIAHQGIRVGRKTYLVDLSDGNKRTSYVAVSNTVIGFILLVLSLIGTLTQFISIAGLVLIFSMMALAGVVMASKLPEIGS